LPGHTDDSIALLDREAGFLWSGDSFYAGPIWLFFPETDLAAYRESVAKLAALAPKLRAVFPAHNTPKANPALLLALRDSLDRVLAGKVDPVPVGDGNVEFRFAGFSFLMRENYHSLAADDNVVNVYNWADYIGPNTLQQFEAEYGIKVNYDTYPSSEVLDAKLLIGNTGYDVVVHSNSFATRFAPIGIYEKLDMSRLSNLKNLDPTIMSRLDIYAAVNGYNIPYHWGTTGYTWNAEMVHARIPDYPGTNGDMIFDPDIVARLADCGVTLLDSPTDLFPMVMAYLGRDPSVLDEDSVAAAVTQLDLVRPYIRYFSNEKIVSDMATGELCVAQSWSGTYGQALRRTREAGIDINLRYTVPAEGSGVWVDGLYILSDAKHKDNAYLFLDFMLRPEIAAEVANMVYYANANSASWPLLDPEMFANPAVFPDDETWARLFASLPPNPKQERYMTRAFSRLKSGL
jgi:putrescine transport system substrate-binding protein